MNTTENNKMIAEFMGAKYYKVDNIYSFNYMPNKRHTSFDPSYLKFHSSWNWLMPVVEKIESIKNYRYDFEIKQSCIEIYDKDNQEDIISTCGDTKKEVIYYAVVEFIKYYNAKNQQKTKMTKIKNKYNEGEKVYYLPKLLGFNNKKALTINHIIYKEKDTLAESMGIESKPHYLYCFKENNLCANESDISKTQ